MAGHTLQGERGQMAHQGISEALKLADGGQGAPVLSVFCP